MKYLCLGLLAFGAAACGSGSTPFASPVDGGPGFDVGLVADSSFKDGAPTASCADAKVLVWSSTNAGNDGVWATADDTINAIEELRLDGAGFLRITAVVDYGSAGTDGTWGTADDVPGYAQRRERTATGALLNIWQSSGAGADGLWGTADDPISTVNAYTSNANGQLLEGRFHSGFGADQAWLTADDTISARDEFVWTNDDLTQTSYSGAGKDGIWGTSDDSVQLWIHAASLGKGIPAELRFYQGAGVDGVWKTADDVISMIEVNDCKTGRTTDYSGAGADQTWGTADDIVSGMQWFTGPAECIATTCNSIVFPN